MKILTTKTENFPHRKILITGSSGFVGKHLVKRLSEKHEIVGFDLVDGQNVLDSKLLSEKMAGVDIVVHLAAFISAMESWKKPLEYFENNTLGTASVVNCAKKAGVKKIIFFSSAAAVAKPFTPYGVSKINAEKILLLYKDKINVVIVRPENIYGDGQKREYGYVIHNFINAVRSGSPIKIYGDGEQGRDFIYIDDVVATVEKLIEKDIESGTVVSLGTGKETKIIDLAETVMKVMGEPTKIEFLPRREEPVGSVADIRVLSGLGIDPKEFVGLEEGIKKTRLIFSPIKIIKWLFVKLLKINRILFPFIIIVSFLLFSLETYKFSGFVKRYFFITPRNLLVICFLSTLLLFCSSLIGKKKDGITEKIEKIVMNINLIISPLILLFSFALEFLEQTKYPNYVLLTFHVNLLRLPYIICLNFLLLTYRFAAESLPKVSGLKADLIKITYRFKKFSIKRFSTTLIQKFIDNPVLTIVFALLVLITFLTFKDYGIGWDEGITVNMGDDAYHFYQSFGRNVAYLSNYAQPQYAIYGQIIETIRSFISHIFRNNSFEFYHLYIGLISLAAFYFVYKTVCLITKNKIISSISPLFLLFMPRFFGDMFNNTKDIGPAIFVSIIIYLSVLVFSHFDKRKKSWLIFLGVAIGVGATLRISVLYFVPLFIVFYFILYLKSKENLKLLVGDTFWLMSSMFVTMHICTPYLLTIRPILGLVDMFVVSQRYPWPGTVLYDGKYILSTQLPWHYLPNWIVITTPLFILFFALVFFIFISVKLLRRSENDNIFFIKLYGSFLILSFIIPILSVIAMRPTLYDAWRQFLFLSIPLSLMAVLGFYFLVAFLDIKRIYKLIACTLLLMGVVRTGIEYVRLHPYEYVYFNSLIGGLRGADGKYETDYWAKSNKESVVWLKKYTSDQDNVKVYTCADELQSSYYFSDVMHFTDKEDASYNICFTRWKYNMQFDKDKIIYIVHREGVPLNYVMEAKN